MKLEVIEEKHTLCSCSSGGWERGSSINVGSRCGCVAAWCLGSCLLLSVWVIMRGRSCCLRMVAGLRWYRVGWVGWDDTELGGLVEMIQSWVGWLRWYSVGWVGWDDTVLGGLVEMIIIFVCRWYYTGGQMLVDSVGKWGGLDTWRGFMKMVGFMVWRWPGIPDWGMTMEVGRQWMGRNREPWF